MRVPSPTSPRREDISAEMPHLLERWLEENKEALKQGSINLFAVVLRFLAESSVREEDKKELQEFRMGLEELAPLEAMARPRSSFNGPFYKLSLLLALSYAALLILELNFRVAGTENFYRGTPEQQVEQKELKRARLILRNRREKKQLVLEILYDEQGTLGAFKVIHPLFGREFIYQPLEDESLSEDTLEELKNAWADLVSSLIRKKG